MNRYSYSGPVMEFDTCVQNNWKSETVAMSKKKAKCNLVSQWKKKNNRAQNAKIALPGKIELVS